MALGQCTGCGEWFGGLGAFDRHLRVRRVTVTTPKGHVVEGEQRVTCRPVDEFARRGLHPRPDAKRGRIWGRDAPGDGAGVASKPRKLSGRVDTPEGGADGLERTRLGDPGRS